MRRISTRLNFSLCVCQRQIYAAGDCSAEPQDQHLETSAFAIWPPYSIQIPAVCFVLHTLPFSAL